MQYTFKSGRKISVDNINIKYSDLAKGPRALPYYEWASGKEIAELKQMTIFFEEGTNKPYFEFDGEIKFLDDYDYFTVAELAEILELNPTTIIYYDQFLATILRDTDDVAFIPNSYGPNFMEPTTVLEAILVPIETKNNPKSKWSYKIPLMQRTNSGKTIIVEHQAYTLDMIGNLVNRKTRLVSKKKYLEENKRPVLLEKIFGPKPIRDSKGE